jgi:serine O-acetyltransferase
MFERVRRDLQRYFAIESRTGAPSLLEKAKIVFESHGLKAILVHRFGFWIDRSVSAPILRLPLKAFYLSLHETMNALWGIYIHGAADIEGGLFIPHPNGVMIGAVRMGEDCCVSQNATIGVRPGAGVKDSPTLGNRVWIGPGAVLFGRVKVADGVAIGALTVVGRNLPPRCLASGNPMQIVKRNFDNSSLLYGDRPPLASASAAKAPAPVVDPGNAATIAPPTSVGSAPR